jgi:hypothetical protein
MEGNSEKMRKIIVKTAELSAPFSLTPSLLGLPRLLLSPTNTESVIILTLPGKLAPTEQSATRAPVKYRYLGNGQYILVNLTFTNYHNIPCACPQTIFRAFV